MTLLNYIKKRIDLPTVKEALAIGRTTAEEIIKLNNNKWQDENLDMATGKSFSQILELLNKNKEEALLFFNKIEIENLKEELIQNEGGY